MDREVEVINNVADDGVLDLTGNKGPATNPTAEDTNADDANKQPGEGDEEGEKPADGEKPQEGEKPADDANKEDEGEKKDDESDAPEYHFGGEQVEVEVPAEISAALAEAGVDEKALLGELFAKDGKFELTAETKAKLDEKFGKVMVDGYLNLYRGLNQQVLADHAKTQADATAAQEAMHSEYVELVGGKEGLEAMEAFILANFDDKQIASYNAVMGGDSWEAQKMVIGMARQQMALHDKVTKGDRGVELLSDTGSSTPSGDPDPTAKGYITGAEYQKLMDSDKYWSDRDYQRRVDSMRSQSIHQGR